MGLSVSAMVDELPQFKTRVRGMKIWYPLLMEQYRPCPKMKCVQGYE